MPIDPVPYLLAAVATRASSARAAGAGSGGGAGAGTAAVKEAARTGGGVAARACPIRKPLVRYRKAPLDACKAKNLSRAR